MAAERKRFPRDPDQFGDDPRISFSKESKTYLLEDENGVEWEWFAAKQAWRQTITEEEMKQQAEAYKIAGVDENAPAFNPAQKRKEAQMEALETNPKGSKSGPGAGGTAGSHDVDVNAPAANGASDAKPAAKAPKPNTAIFVTGLPIDADRDDLRAYFSKFGVIKESADDDEKRIIMYNDDEGNFKGEALIIFMKPESAYYAVDLYDGQVFPYDGHTGPMSISYADRSSKYAQGKVPADQSTKPKVSAAKAKKKREDMLARLNDWSGTDTLIVDDGPKQAPLKVVKVSNAFFPSELKHDEDLAGDLERDLYEDAKKYGQVKKVTVFDLEKEGVATVRFTTEGAAKELAAALNGRKWNKWPLKTSLISVSNAAKFRKTEKTDADKEREEQKALEKFSKDIEAGGD